MLLLSFLSMFFKQFSESKHIAVKRLEGYTLLQSLVDVFKEFLLYYFVLFFICIIASLVAFFFISEIELGVFYFINNYKIILFVFFIIPILYSLSCVNIYLVKPLETLKGNNNKKGVYLLTIVSKYFRTASIPEQVMMEKEPIVVSGVLKIILVAPIVKSAPSEMMRRSLSFSISLSTKVPVLLGPSLKVYVKRPFLEVTRILQCSISMLGSFVSIGVVVLLPFI